MKTLYLLTFFLFALAIVSCGDNVSGSNAESSDDASFSSTSSSSASYSSQRYSSALRSSSSEMAVSSSTAPQGPLLAVSVPTAPGVIISAFLHYPDIAYAQGLFAVELKNQARTSRTFRVKLEITGYSDPLVESVTVPANSVQTVPLTPVLKANIFADLTELRTASVALSVQEGEVIHYEQSFKSKLTANNVMAWGYNDKGTTVRYDQLVAGWVTPAAQAIKDLISSANSYLESGYAFSGYQSAPLVYMTSMTLDGLCCATDGPLAGARDPYFELSGPGSFNYVSATKDNNASSKLTWTTFVQLSQSGNYLVSTKDEDGLSDDNMWAKTIALPDSFFTARLESLNFANEGISLTASWQYASMKQAEAIYQAFKAMNMSYVNSANLDFGLAQGSTYVDGEYTGQTIRLPYQSLVNKSFNCIDGAVMFASALENVGIDAFIVLVTGHAYVGWYNDAEHSRIGVLETTLIPSADFSKAYNSAAQRYTSDKMDSQFRIVDIKKSRLNGITPLP